MLDKKPKSLKSQWNLTLIPFRLSLRSMASIKPFGSRSRIHLEIFMVLYVMNHFPKDLHYWFIYMDLYISSALLMDTPISQYDFRHEDTVHAHFGGLRGGMETATGIKRGGRHLDDEPIVERSNGRLLDDQGTKISESTKEYTWIQVSIISFDDQAAVELVIDTLIQSGWPLDRENSLNHYASKSSQCIKLIGQHVKAEGILFLPLERAQHFGLHSATDTCWPFVTHMLLATQM